MILPPFRVKRKQSRFNGQILRSSWSSSSTLKLELFCSTVRFRWATECSHRRSAWDCRDRKKPSFYQPPPTLCFPESVTRKVRISQASWVFHVCLGTCFIPCFLSWDEVEHSCPLLPIPGPEGKPTMSILSLQMCPVGTGLPQFKILLFWNWLVVQKVPQLEKPSSTGASCCLFLSWTLLLRGHLPGFVPQPLFWVFWEIIFTKKMALFCLASCVCPIWPSSSSVGDNTSPLFVPSALFQKPEKLSPRSVCDWPSSAYQSRSSRWWTVSPSSAAKCTDRPFQSF